MNLSKWYQFIKPNFRFYKDGFFEFPYLANTPELFIESTIKSPGSKHVPEEQVVYRNNPFINGEMHYRKIDEGLWLSITNLKFKYDTVIKSSYAKGIPSDHYSVTFTVFDSEVKLQNVFIDKVPFQSKFWSFKKPGTDVGACFYKESKCQFYIYYISPSWIEKHVPLDELDSKIPFKKFLDSSKGFISYQDIVPNAETLSHEILDTFKTFNKDPFSATILKAQSLSILTTFFKNVFNDSRTDNYQEKSSVDYNKIAKCELLISKKLSKPFMGIDALAKTLNISSSKLKTDFKSVYGTSILQYNIDKKMELAMHLTLNTSMQIKQIAKEVGYDSPSKFTAIFKKKHGKLPSELRSDTLED
ncbi:AraC family transcriptional regulator [Tamlana sp. 2_MG-2023]|uniref:helix-turn-helix domain-containing protein n=1 Tax=unclassified Tamlana TaxID=2614803 RepID=UPI0026E19B4B|nr:MULTISPECIES: AraC family transcriptional regulator [unclassified Tamlana]MDO6759962.1 AraC family transcriptional regulator [Tamlana sp. 2_MG-2023]MDO6791868.1 AraC family transcriptional regulator [Tamlana sp. 1_MG-2023]